VLACALSLLAPGQARAAGTEIDRAMARSLAAEGYEALVKKKFATAEDRLRRADELFHAPTIVVDHARALVGLGRLVEARERYQLVIREGVEKNAPAPWKQALADAQREVADVEKRIAWLLIRVEGPTEPTVVADDKPVPPAELGTRRATDPGLRVIRVTAEGYQPQERSLTLAEGEERELSFELVELDAASPSDGATPSGTGPSGQAGEGSRYRIPMWAAFGAGGVGLVVGSVTGALTLGAYSDLDGRCPEQNCEPTTLDQKRQFQGDRQRYRTLATLSSIGFGVALVGAGAGVWLFLLDRQHSGKGETGSLVPLIGPSEVGVMGRF
jgi:hypothetical protein